jgi:iron complex outermembrane receptor protein
MQPNYYYNISSDSILGDQIFWNKTNIDINISSAKVDYETPFKNGKLGFGGKVSYVTTKNTLDFYDVINIPRYDSSQSDRFNYTENINALYINYNKTINVKWAIQSGLRVENTYSKGILTRALYKSSTPEDSVTNNYTDFFPSAAVTYIVNDNNTFNLSYSRRIDRPDYQSLNPFEIKLDELTYEKGNAFLRPQYTNTLELTHTFKNKFNTAFSYSHVKDFNARIIDTTQISRSYITQTNLNSQDIFSINFYLPFQVNKWWNIYANINAYHSLYQGIVDSGRTNIDLAIASYSLYMQQIFTLGKNYSAELTGYYDGPSVWEGTFKTNPAGGVDVGLQKKLFNKKADIKLSCSDIFYTLPWHATSNYGGANIDASGNWESRMIKLNFTYHFGKSLQTTEHKVGNEEETKRTKSSEGLGGN